MERGGKSIRAMKPLALVDQFHAPALVPLSIIIALVIIECVWKGEADTEFTNT